MSEQRIAVIKARIAEREGKPGYKRNVAALKTELQKLELAQAGVSASKSPTPDLDESGEA